MKIEAILWSNGAAVNENGLLVVDGGGWRFVEAPEFPTTVRGNVCGVFEVESGDFGSVHTVSLTIFDDAGQVEGSAGSITMDCREASAQMSSPRLPFAFPFSAVAREPTLLKARVGSNGDELGGLSVIVRRTQPDG